MYIWICMTQYFVLLASWNYLVVHAARGLQDFDNLEDVRPDVDSEIWIPEVERDRRVFYPVAHLRFRFA